MGVFLMALTLAGQTQPMLDTDRWIPPLVSIKDIDPKPPTPTPGPRDPGPTPGGGPKAPTPSPTPGHCRGQVCGPYAIGPTLGQMERMGRETMVNPIRYNY